MSGVPRGIYVFYEAADPSKQLYYSRFDGQAWTLNMKVPQTMTESVPSAVMFNGQLYCFYQYGGSVWFNVFDGSTWLGYQGIPDTGASCSPSAVVYDGQIYVFHQGTNYCGQLWCNVMSAGGGWAGDALVPDTTLQHSPSALVYTDQTSASRLLCFHQGCAGAVDTIWYNQLGSGGAWQGDVQVPATTLTGSPAVVQHGNRLFLLHAGQEDAEQLWCNIFLGEQEGWSGDTMLAAQALSNRPNACVFGGRIYCFFNVWGSDKTLCCATRVGSEWASEWALSDVWLTGSPGAVAV